MGSGAANRFWAELRVLYEAADKPALSALARLGKAQKPPIIISTSTIHEWLNGGGVPTGKKSVRYFTVLVPYLQHWADRNNGYRPRPEAWWQDLLNEARAEREARKGGRPHGSSPPKQVAPIALPAATADFTGRAEALAELLECLDPRKTDPPGTGTPGTVVAVAGMTGVGKTALAVRAAHDAHERAWFPGGILFHDLRGFSLESPLETSEIAEHMLRSFGIFDREIPPTPEEKVQLWRSLSMRLAAEKRPILLVLDNAASAGQISPLLPPPPHKVLVTSRRTMSTLPAHSVELAPLPPEDAMQLLDAGLRAAHPGDDRVSAFPADARRLLTLCGHLPLALQIIAALLRDEPDRALADQADDLDDAATRLDRIHYDDVDEQGRPLAVRIALDLSYARLRVEQARAFRLLTLAPGSDASTETAAILFDLAVTDGRRLLADLARFHLLERHPWERWRMHDLVGLYAAEKSRANADDDLREEALDRLFAHLVGTVYLACDQLEARRSPLAGENRLAHRDDALAWLDTERDNLVEAVHLARDEHRFQVAQQLSSGLAIYLLRRRGFEQLHAVANTAALAAERSGDRLGRGHARLTVGIALIELSRFQEAIDILHQAVEDYRGTDQDCVDPLSALGDALCGERRFDEGIATLEQALRLARDSGKLDGLILLSLGNAFSSVNRIDEAIAAHRQAIESFGKIDDTYDVGIALVDLGNSLCAKRHFDEGIAAYRRAINIFRDESEQHEEYAAMLGVGSALSEAYRLDEALTILEATADHFHGTGERHHEATTLMTLAHTLKRADRRDEARATYHRSIDAFQETSDRLGEAKALEGLASTLSEVGGLDEAMTYHQLALHLFREFSERLGEATALANLGHTLQRLERLDEALMAHRQAIDIARELDNEYVESLGLAGLGRALYHSGRPDEAIATLKHAARILRDLGDQHTEASVLNDLHEILTSTAQREELIPILERAVHLFHETGNPREAGRALLNLGVALIHAGRGGEAANAEKKAAEIFHDLQDPRNEIMALSNLAAALILTDRNEAAATYQEVVQKSKDIGDQRLEQLALRTLQELSA